MRIGVDVGGTNTDAVLMDGATVAASIKTPTTADVGAGVVAAIRGVLAQSATAPETVTAVMIGTTQFTNAIVERRRLVPVAIVRLALPATESLDPLIDWPRDLADTIGRNVYMAKGGYEVDGREISPLDEADIACIARDIAARDLHSVAVSSVFAPLNGAQEKRAAEIIRAEHPDAQITLSSEIGRVGLIERENAAVMNAALVSLSAKVVGSFREALKELEIDAPFFISQNDGTLMSAAYVERYPVLTFASGPPTACGARPSSRTRRTPWWWISAAPPPMSACWPGASPGNPRSPSTSAACAPTSACRTCWRSGWAAAAWCGAPTRSPSAPTRSASS